MEQKVRRFWVQGAAVMLMVALLLSVACGDDEEAAPAAAEPAPAAAEPAPTVAAVATAAAVVPTSVAVVLETTGSEAGEVSNPGAIPLKDAEGIKYGGILNIMSQYETTDLDPTRRTSPQGHTTPYYNKLLRWDPFNPSVAVPDLATSWEVDDSGTVYTFTIREGVKFHDGAKFSAQDVDATWTWMNYTWDNFGHTRRLAGQLADVVKSWRAVDDVTFEVTLNFPFASFLNFIASPHYVIVPKTQADAAVAEMAEKESFIFLFTGDDKPPVGTGPFQHKKYRPAVSLEIERNDAYWNLDRNGNPLPYLDGVKNIVLTDPALRIAAITTKRLDLWPNWPLMNTEDKDRLVERLGDKVRVISAASIKFDPIYFNMRKAPGNDPLFRQMIIRIMDLDEFEKRVFQNNASMGQMVDPVAFPGWTLPEDELKTSPLFWDQERKLEDAKRILGEMGYATPQEHPSVQIVVRSTGFYVAEAELLGAQLSAFGIPNTVEVYTSTVGSARAREGLFDIFASGPGITVLDPINSIQQAYLTTPGAPDPWVTATGEPAAGQLKVDELYLQYLGELDAAKRKEILYDIQRVVYFEEGTTTHKIPLAYPKLWVTIWNDVRGVFVLGLYEGWDREYTWLDR